MTRRTRYLLLVSLAILASSLVWMLVHQVVLARLSTELAIRLEKVTGRPVTLHGLGYQPFLGLSLDRLEVEDSIQLTDLRVRFRRIPRSKDLSGLAIQLGALATDQLPAAVARPALLLEKLHRNPAWPRSLRIGSFTYGRFEGRLHLRSTGDRMNLELSIQHAYPVHLSLEHDIQAASTRLNLRLDAHELPFSAPPGDPPSLELELLATHDQEGPWALQGIASLYLANDRLDFRYCAELDPETWFTLPVYHQDGSKEELLAQGELKFTSGILATDRVSITILPRLLGLFPLRPGFLDRAIVPAWLEAGLHTEDQDVSALLDLVPQSLLGKLAQAEVSGSLDLEAFLTLPLYDIADASLSLEHRLHDFTLTTLPGYEGLFMLDQAFTQHIANDFHNNRLELQVPAYRPPPLDWLLLHSERGEGWARLQDTARAEARLRQAGPKGYLALDSQSGFPALVYSRVDEVSPYLVAAVLTAEDGDFFFHPGINWRSLTAAVARNLAAGGLDFGASTISMQVIKNLFLDQERTLARKLQEALLVYLMEEQLRIPKARILELYLNIAEFGPGVYGAEQAARYYFSIPAADLSLGQAVWLASILPSPKRYHSYLTAGAISPGWFIRMVSLMDVMLERGRIDQADYDLASVAPPPFAPLSDPP